MRQKLVTPLNCVNNDLQNNRSITVINTNKRTNLFSDSNVFTFFSNFIFAAADFSTLFPSPSIHSFLLFRLSAALFLFFILRQTRFKCLSSAYNYTSIDNYVFTYIHIYKHVLLLIVSVTLQLSSQIRF